MRLFLFDVGISTQTWRFHFFRSHTVQPELNLVKVNLTKLKVFALPIALSQHRLEMKTKNPKASRAVGSVLHP
jgi:hypothetical protein